MTDAAMQESEIEAARSVVPDIAAMVIPVAQMQVAEHISTKSLKDMIAAAMEAAESRDALQYGVVMRHLAALALAQAAIAAIPGAKILLQGDLH